MPATVENPVKVNIYHLACKHVTEFESPSVTDPAGMYMNKPRDPDGVVRCKEPGICNACAAEGWRKASIRATTDEEETIPPSGKVLALEVLAEGIVSQIHAVEKQLGMIASERNYFEKMIYLSMRGQLNG